VGMGGGGPWSRPARATGLWQSILRDKDGAPVCAPVSV